MLSSKWYTPWVVALAAAAGPVVGAAPPEPVVEVNGHVLTAAERAALTQRLGARPLPGRFWYDPRSGLWGRLGGPSIGRLPPALPVAAALPPDASGRGTGVFVNGRELHLQEVQRLQAAFGEVRRGRYWLEADGTAGVEGGPPAWNVYATAQRPKWLTGGHNWRGGSVLGGGGTVGFIGTDGNSVICEGGSCTFN